MQFIASFSALCAVFSLGVTASAATPVVTNVVASQRAGAKLVDIRYDVFDGDGDTLKVRVEVSHDGGITYFVPAFSLSGDVGSDITPGTNKLIVWNAGLDWDGEFSTQMRAKVIASDGRGFPGMQWGLEVAPGGFLLGQGGGPEGTGPASHVSIPYSYWLSKHEITVEQYAEFLNAAIASRDVVRVGSQILSSTNSLAGIPAQTPVCSLGNDIQWVLTKFVAIPANTKLPIAVNWYGALAFAQFYGYDLPTDAEWEKAARGSAHDGLSEHLSYPWGNSITHANANYEGGGRTPVGFYNGTQSPAGPDMGNAYALYDIAGNVAEWTRTRFIESDVYPSIENVEHEIHSLAQPGGRSLRGGSYVHSFDWLQCYRREGPLRESNPGFYGFRVVRRQR